jgi:GR25 family glycosyltransferase involved in LPS biosynthesis
MNLERIASPLRQLVFRVVHAARSIVPGGKIDAFGASSDKIETIMVINLDRQPHRWRQVMKELGRFRTGRGEPLTSIVKRFAAIDARDGRAVAATADVDPNYHIGDQLHVQPDSRLSACFDDDEPVKMTRQEIAVARSHIEVWKYIATGPHNYVLVIEDDIWFRSKAAASIDRGWRAALQRFPDKGPQLLYLSYVDAGGSADRADICDNLFRPMRGLWFLSGYVLSKEGAAALLRSMPVIGPVDMWINYRFNDLRALALSSPAILQRPDGSSDNAYSILPFLARAGIVDANPGDMSPRKARIWRLLAWSSGGERESLAMALSMLGLRVLVFDEGDEAIGCARLRRLFEVFDALVDPPLSDDSNTEVLANEWIRVVVEADVPKRPGFDPTLLPSSRTLTLTRGGQPNSWWGELCSFLNIVEPNHAFPFGAPRGSRLFRDDRQCSRQNLESTVRRSTVPMDDSPWVLPPEVWRPPLPVSQRLCNLGPTIMQESMTSASPEIRSVAETFPGNLAVFAHDSVTYDHLGATLSINEKASGQRPYQSGALASKQNFTYGRFSAEIRAAPGAGLVTGFFLHRHAPRQEIDIELLGNTPSRMLINVFFNPGDDGTALDFGYRGTPFYIDLGFDSTAAFHLYEIDWHPNYIAWFVDGKIVHERVGWDPTPIPHLPMRLHANLWAPRSEQFAAKVDNATLPSTATFKNISIS